MTKEFKLTPAKLKKAGKELQAILEPTDDDGNDISITDGSADEIKTKIIEAGNELTSEDAISKNLEKVLEALNTDSANENENENSEEDPLTWDDINSMNTKELKTLCEEKQLITDSTDYEEVKDFRKDAAIELGIEVPEEPIKEEPSTDKEKPKKKSKKKAESKKKEKEPEIDEDLIELVNGTKKLKDLKEIVENNEIFGGLIEGLDDYKGLSGPRLLKPLMLDILGVKPEDSKPKEKPKEKAKSKSEDKREKVQKKGKETPKEEKLKYTRGNSVITAIKEYGKKGFTFKEMLKNSDNLFIKNGGKSNQTATNINKNMLDALVGFDILSFENKIYKLN